MYIVCFALYKRLRTSPLLVIMLLLSLPRHPPVGKLRGVVKIPLLPEKDVPTDLNIRAFVGLGKRWEGREGGREGGKEGGREGGGKRWEGREGGKEGGREGGRKGGREGGVEVRKWNTLSFPVYIGVSIPFHAVPSSMCSR